ncbi:MAG TPA: hypothetical protein VHD36_16000, partial [Pirellulales bacterium]|nr:hypothetical protein [Pirellulales bacterium]
MMTTDVFRRVLWKEYRVLRAFWIAVVAIVVAVQAIAWLFLATGEAYQTFDIVVSVFIALYALAAGAILFAVEREEGTDTFLTTLPVGSGRLFVPKVALAIASTLALAAVLLLIVRVWQAVGLMEPVERIGIWANGKPRDPFALAAIACDVFACGLLCSLLLKRPLVAACVGAGVAVLVTYLGTFIQTLMAGPVYGTNPDEYGRNWSVTIFALSAGVFLIDIAIGQRWLEWGTVRIKRRRAATTAAQERAAAAARRPPQGSTWRGAFGRLVWQELRQTWRMMAIYLGIGTLLTLWMLTPDGARDTNANSAIVLAAFFTALMGASTFYADQERSQYRFFGERPVRPRMVWLNRLSVWGTVIFLFLAVATPLWVAVIFKDLSLLVDHIDHSYVYNERTPGSFTGTLFQLPAILTLAVLVSLTYASGQLCSMLLRSGIIAAFMGVILAAVMVAWSVGMSALGVNWLISIAPLPLIMLWVTWLRAPHWIAERSGWWPWTRLGLSLAVPILAVGIATASFRILQIPVVEPGFSPEQYVDQVTPAARETAQMYLRAASMVDSRLWEGGDPSVGRGDHLVAGLAGLLDTAPYFHEISARRDWIRSFANPRQKNMLAWLEANREPLKLALETTARTSCAFDRSGEHLWRVSVLESLIGTEAYRRIEAGDLAGALDCEIALLRFSAHMSAHQFQPSGNRVAWRTLDVIARYWATRPGQTPELLRQAIGAIENWQQMVLPPTDVVKATYVWDERLLALDSDAISENPHRAANVLRYTLLHYLMPWEVYRARRALDYLTSEQLRHVQAVENAVRAGQPTARLQQQEIQLYQNSVRQTTPVLGMLTHGYWGADVRLWLEQQAQLNATLLLLGLEGHRLEHGSLPVSLDELVGEYFQKLPRDPYSGDSFRYFPHGVPTVEKIRHGVASRWDWTIAAGVPFLWSCGPDLLPITNRGDMDDVFLGIGGTVGEP